MRGIDLRILVVDHSPSLRTVPVNRASKGLSRVLNQVEADGLISGARVAWIY